jgi:hypothetical protein
MSHRRRLPARIWRRKAKVRPKIAIAIFCEGRRTEPEYLKALRAEYRNVLIDVKISGGQGVPTSIVDAAVEHRKSARTYDSFEENDQIWIVFDRDEHDIARAFNKARDNGIGVAYSNPCFELWAILHLTDHDAPLDRSQLQQLLEKKMPKYKRRGSKCFDYEMIRSSVEMAEDRAEKMAARRVQQGDPLGNPYTSVYELTRLIRQKRRR